MRFAEIFIKKQTPEWRHQYFQYQLGKAKLQEIKTAKSGVNPERLQIESAFFDFLALELNKINGFYEEMLGQFNEKFTEIKKKLDDFFEQTANPNPNVASNSYGTFRDARLNPTLKLADFELAYSEFYLSLILLQNYQKNNATAFRKILKKYDKIANSTSGQQWFHFKVQQATFVTSKELGKLVADVEQEVTDRLADGDRKRAMDKLRVPPLDEPYHSSWTVLRIGLWIGALSIFMILLGIMIPWSLCNPEDRGCWQDSCLPHNFTTDPLANDAPKFWEITIRLYRGIFLFSLMILLLGINVYVWAETGINHVLIFELDPRDHLSSFHLIEAGISLILVSSMSLSLWLAQFYLAYVFDVNPLTIRYIALGSLAFIVAFLLNPIPVFKRSSRNWLLKCIFRIVTAPFHEVKFADFWLADQFTSLVPVFQDFVFVICCCSLQFEPSNVELTCVRQLFILTNIIGCLPAWFRFWQCIRRFWDSKLKHPHLTNAGKYATTFMVVTFRSLHAAWDSGDIGPGFETTTTTQQNSATPETQVTLNVENPFIYCWIVAGTLQTAYTYYWDIKMDWGLWDKNAPEDKRFLREHLIFSRKWYYYGAMVLDLLLRLSWTLTVADIQISNESYQADLFITSLTFIEMFRRFVWNFFRLENEHINNVNELRAVREIVMKTRQEKPSEKFGFLKKLQSCWSNKQQHHSTENAVLFESYNSKAELIVRDSQLNPGSASTKPGEGDSVDRETPAIDENLLRGVVSVQVLESFAASRIVTGSTDRRFKTNRH